MKLHSVLVSMLSSASISAIVSNSVLGASLTSNSRVIVNNRIIGNLTATVNKAPIGDNTFDNTLF